MNRLTADPMLSDPKAQTILESAWQAFSAYGFRKTSMDDIARGAGMSRPAVYLHFRNKEAIFTALVEAYYRQAREDIRGANARVGGMLPDIALEDLDGTPVRISDFRGRRVLITFERSVDW